jgi:hypothetical protein
MNTLPVTTDSNTLSPAASAARLLKTYAPHNTKLATIRTALAEQAEHVRQGDLSGIEEMLLSQAAALHSIFVHHATEAAKPISWLQHQQTHLSLALKAQARAQATLQTLVNMKAPRQAATFVQQQNVAQNQIVNPLPQPDM